MEFILRNTDIFDDNIDGEFRNIILAYKDDFIEGKMYRVSMSFHVNLLNNPRCEGINVPIQSKASKNTKKDKINDLLSFRLNELEQVLAEYGIVSYKTTIQGEYLDAENIIKLEIKEDNNIEQNDIGKRKNKGRLKVRSIVPSLPFTQETASKLASERLSQIYHDFMNVIRNKAIMSEILEIEATENDNQLFKAFAEQYRDLWLATDERRKELLNKFQERSMLVLEKYLDKTQ
ncbi:hypothetical protein [Paenibacillus vini]|uniref:Uncharacterized protein n=1 Tax=Paenibacillus vini TaxID=1476024 RepID=A0ABQ4MC06_9BACL|nr:hypothetical protein [Paenibacillus vini]GIP52960.1 hypothetical protein J42TS3_19950 [Paenibacillus vini]